MVFASLLKVGLARNEFFGSLRPMTTKHTLLEFPCDFQIKVIGKNEDQFISEVITITSKYFPMMNQELIRKQVSQNSQYISMTLTVYAQDQKTLDALYTELSQHPNAHMVL